MTQHLELIISDDLIGYRLDKAICKLSSQISRNQLQKMIKQGFVTINDNITTDPAFLVKDQDVIRLIEKVVVAQAVDTEPSSIKLDIVYEDEHLLVLNKEAGVTVHPGAGWHQETLVSALRYHCANLSDIGGLERPGIVHRLDKDTSGLMVVAKTNQAHNSLAQQIIDRKLLRRYKAIVWGVPREQNGTINLNIGRSRTNHKSMAIYKHHGRHAITHYFVDTPLAGRALSLVECRLETGRTHQIRVHLSNIGHSVLGDQLYGHNDKKINKTILSDETKALLQAIKRQALHSFYIKFEHPVTQEIIERQVPLPTDMEKIFLLLK